jgi:hypothetical protein
MKITIEISDDDAMHINALIEHTKLYDNEANSHGPLSFKHSDPDNRSRQVGDSFEAPTELF